MLKLQLIIISFIITSNLIGQFPCKTSEISFIRQTQLDSFDILFPNCSYVENINIYGTQINNVKSLKGITKANAISIKNTQVSNLEGLHNLIEASLILTQNNNLLHIKHIKNLKKSSKLSLDECKNVESFEGISGDSIRSIYLSGNFNNIQNLSDIYCLSALSLSIIDWKYKNLSGGFLPNIKNLLISGTENIDSIDRFTNLELFTLEYSNITNLSPLNRSFKLKSLNLNLNKNLSNCSTDLICDKLNDPSFRLTTFINKSGCNTIDEIKAACTSSQEDDDQQRQIRISPNPTHDILTIDGSPLGTEIMVYDVSGQLVMKCAPLGAESATLDLSQVKSGMYFLRMLQPSRADYAMYKIVKL